MPPCPCLRAPMLITFFARRLFVCLLYSNLTYKLLIRYINFTSYMNKEVIRVRIGIHEFFLQHCEMARISGITDHIFVNILLHIMHLCIRKSRQILEVF